MKRGKKYLESVKNLGEETHVIDGAIKLMKEAAYAAFDESVELHFNLGIDPRHADQQIRGTLNLPHGTGKSIRIAVIAKGQAEADAIEAGADTVGSDDLVEKIQKGWLDFDLLIATPSMMSKVGRLGKILGSKGLMPNPKSGTVTGDLAKTVKEFKSGKVEYRNDKYGIIHVGIGKMSFDEQKLNENLETVFDVMIKVRPSKAKGIYMKSVSLSSTMSPSINLETQKIKWEDN